MVSIEELSARYPTRSVPPFGDCIVIPGAEFDPDWEAILCDDFGCAVLFTDLDGRPVTLIRGKTGSKAGGKLVYRPPSAPPVPAHVPAPLTGLRKTGTLKRVSSNGYNWTEDETGLLVELWNKRLKTKEIIRRVTQRFPGRTETAVKLRIVALARKGVIRPRWKCRKRGAEPEPKKKRLPDLPIPLPGAGKLPTALPTPVYAAVYAGLDRALVEIRDEVYGMVKEHGDFRSLHEGYAVVLEELDELWDEVKRPPESRDLQRLRAEALDVAASAAKLALFIEKERI